MPDPALLLLAFFLPLFPFSVGFNALYARLSHPGLRLGLLLLWPLIGIGLYYSLEPEIPAWVLPWAVATALLYAFRLVAMREVGLWTGFLATSIWACLWPAAVYAGDHLILYALGFGVPLAILTLLVAGLEQRFGAAYAGLYGGLALTVPRLSGVLVVAILAATATPLFPGFFVMIDILVGSDPLVAIALVALWGLWSWAGARLMQGLIVGPAQARAIEDISIFDTWLAAVAFIGLAVAGMLLLGGV